MRNLTQITDHGNAAKLRLYDQFQRGDFADLVEGHANQFQELENPLFNMLSERYLANATGQTLTNIGAIVGEVRPTVGSAATDDEVYRALIYARIFANVSEGRNVDIHNILLALGSADTAVMDTYPAGITVNYQRAGIIQDCACIREILEGATAPVSIDITEHSQNPARFGAAVWGAGEFGSTA